MPEFVYPLLKRVSEIFADADLGDVLLLASQHLLEPQREMFRLLLKARLKPENCIVIGKVYSTNQGVMEDLSNMGCVVAPFSLEFDPLQSFDKWFEEKLRYFIESELNKRNLASYRKIIILDDGGFLHLVAKDLLYGRGNVVGIEQTSSGHHKIKTNGVTFPCLSVARSFHKLTLESPLIGRCGYERIIRHLTKRGKRNPKILVKGLGPIGQQTSGQFFVANNYNGYATDLSFSGQRFGIGLMQLLRNKGRLLEVKEATQRLEEFDVVIGATGSSTFTENDIERFHPEVSLISMSSSDREFPSVPFRRNGGGPHDDYYLGRRCLVNAGFPITFYGWPNEMPPQQIELTIAQLMMNVLGEATNHPHQMNYVVEQICSIWEPHEDVDRWYAENFS
jgi:hypothetical protein